MFIFWLPRVFMSVFGIWQPKMSAVYFRITQLCVFIWSSRVVFRECLCFLKEKEKKIQSGQCEFGPYYWSLICHHYWNSQQFKTASTISNAIVWVFFLDFGLEIRHSIKAIWICFSLKLGILFSISVCCGINLIPTIHWKTLIEFEKTVRTDVCQPLTSNDKVFSHLVIH